VTVGENEAIPQRPVGIAGIEAQVPIPELEGGPRTIPEIVSTVYAAYPKHLHPAAGQSVCQHLRKLEGEGHALRTDDTEPLTAAWVRA